MAVFFKCDGCGAELPPDGVKEFGMVRKGQYCAKCAPIVERFYERRDVLHTQLAKKWKTGVATLKRQFAKELPEGRLPDE